MEDLRLPPGTGKRWLYSLGAKPDTNPSLLFGNEVTHFRFQPCAENPKPLLADAALSTNANQQGSSARVSSNILCGVFLSSTAQNFPRILPLLGFGYGSCKVTAVLGGFAARVKAGSRGDVAALYFTLTEVMDAYQHWEWQGKRTACT